MYYVAINSVPVDLYLRNDTRTMFGMQIGVSDPSGGTYYKELSDAVDLLKRFLHSATQAEDYQNYAKEIDNQVTLFHTQEEQRKSEINNTGT